MDPDWFYYISRELLFTQITFTHDVGFIHDSMLEHQSERSDGDRISLGREGSRTPNFNIRPETEAEMLRLIATLKAQSNNLLKQIELQILDIKKERWEFKHGYNLINLVIKHFTEYQQVYKHYLRACLRFEEEESYSYYLPIVNIKLKPLYRVIYLFEEFVGVLTYNISIKTTSAVNQANNIQISNLVHKLGNVIKPLYSEASRLISQYENKSKLTEFRRELIGFDNYIASNPTFAASPPNSSPSTPTAVPIAATPPPGPFILQGMLLKMNNSNLLQNRIFLLFRDILIYGSRISSASGFRIHGFLELFDCQLLGNIGSEEDEESVIEAGGLPVKEGNLDLQKFNGFKIITRSDKVILLYALSKEDKDKWLSELKSALASAKELNLDLSSELIANIGMNGTSAGKSEEIKSNESNNNKVTYNHRANSVIHVTWHRNITISHKQLCHAMKYNLSGYLLRKFKNSAGWQRLFIIFTNITLFFFKSHEDTTPLASLPLLGYKIEIPNPDAANEDLIITKDNVFKLIYKTHVYYFRAESSFTFKRWMNTVERAITIGPSGN